MNEGLENGPSLWKGEPQDEDELEGEVKGKPVDRADGTLDDAADESASDRT